MKFPRAVVALIQIYLLAPFYAIASPLAPRAGGKPPAEDELQNERSVGERPVHPEGLPTRLAVSILFLSELR